jgi:hypothetical protein
MVRLEAMVRDGSKREGMVAGQPGGAISKRLQRSTGLEESKK